MTGWFDERIVETGRLPLFFLLLAFVLTFLFMMQPLQFVMNSMPHLTRAGVALDRIDEAEAAHAGAAGQRQQRAARAETGENGSALELR